LRFGIRDSNSRLQLEKIFIGMFASELCNAILLLAWEGTIMNELVRSSEIMTISFGGDNEIDACLLRDSIENIVLLLESSRDAIAPGNKMKVHISSIRPGSFVFDVVTISDVVPLVQRGIEAAGFILSVFLTFIQLKKTLKGSEPKLVEQIGDNNTAITGNNNQVIIVSNLVYEQYQKTEVNTRVAGLFHLLSEDGTRTDFSVQTRDKSETVDSSEFHALSSPEPFPCESCSTGISHTEAELTLRTPVLCGDAMWGFKYLGRPILATIEDEIFKAKVESASIHFQAKDAMKVRMRIECKLDEDCNIIGSPKYFVTNVLGDVIHKISREERQQNTLFEKVEIDQIDIIQPTPLPQLPAP